jgi:hypothetical protein
LQPKELPTYEVFVYVLEGMPWKWLGGYVRHLFLCRK